MNLVNSFTACCQNLRRPTWLPMDARPKNSIAEHVLFKAKSGFVHFGAVASCWFEQPWHVLDFVSNTDWAPGKCSFAFSKISSWLLFSIYDLLSSSFFTLHSRNFDFWFSNSRMDQNFSFLLCALDNWLQNYNQFLMNHWICGQWPLKFLQEAFQRTNVVFNA